MKWEIWYIYIKSQDIRKITKKTEQTCKTAQTKNTIFSDTRGEQFQDMFLQLSASK
jgi:hypothetical protein